MAVKFSVGQAVTVSAVPPAGPVEAYRMLDDGTIQCLITWIDMDGVQQTRWFNEDLLTAV